MVLAPGDRVRSGGLGGIVLRESYQPNTGANVDLEVYVRWDEPAALDNSLRGTDMDVVYVVQDGGKVVGVADTLGSARAKGKSAANGTTDPKAKWEKEDTNRWTLPGTAISVEKHKVAVSS